MAAQTPARTTQTTLTAGQLAMLAAVALAVIGKGAFYRRGQLLAGAVLALAVVLTAGASRGRLLARGVPRSIVAVVSSLLAFGLWTVARGALGGDHGAGLTVLAFAVALSAGFVAGHLATPPQRAALRRAIVGLGACSAVTGWAGFVWRIDSLALPGGWTWRAAGTLTYENALAGLLAVVALVTIAQLVERWTAEAAVALFLMLVGAAATQSRGGAVVLLIGAVVLIARLGWRAVWRVVWRPGAGAAVAVLGLVPSAPVLAPPHPVPALVALCLGAVLTVWPRRPRSARRSTAVAVGIAVVLLAVAGAGMASRADASTLAALESRLTLKSRHRVAQHRVAVAEVAAHPLIGTGPGQADLRWRQGERTLRARFVHNEYLQVAVELGAVGVVLLLAVPATIARAVWSGRAAGGVPWAGVAAGLVATAVHGAIDFLWHMPVIPFTVLLLAGTATMPSDDAADLGP